MRILCVIINRQNQWLQIVENLSEVFLLNRIQIRRRQQKMVEGIVWVNAEGSSVICHLMYDKY